MYFRIRANYSSGYSALGVGDDCRAFPSRPTGLDGDDTGGGDDRPRLGRLDPMRPATGSNAVRNGTTGWTAIAITGSGVTSFSDSGLPERARYYYRVVATNGVGDSAPSAVGQRYRSPWPPPGVSRSRSSPAAGST